MDWVKVVQDRDLWRGYCQHGNESCGSVKCWDILSSCATGGLEAS
jgi:hypothetical protein